ncbi:MAG: SAM-dependent methyltransferase, partial [Actinobacteria bacterium]|nr:SAM-dependent methyltransferase [Actinomycetota bacterium]
MNGGLWQNNVPGEKREHPRLDITRAHIARVYDYWLDGKDNFAVDREAGDKTLHDYP